MKGVLLYLALMISSIQLLAQRGEHDNLTEHFGQDQEEENANGLRVDPYTGTAKVGYNLFNYSNSTSGLNHNVFIIYDASGVKVDEPASELGLNWSLDLGGSITREVRGIVDENDGWGNNNQAIKTSFTASDASELYGYTNASLDGEFDIYHWRIGNKGGKFVISKSGTILCIPERNVKIEKFFNNSNHPDPYSLPLDDCAVGYTFKITLEDGNKYYFDLHDCSKFNFKNRWDWAPTKWYVTKIESAFYNDNIILNYVSEETTSYIFNVIDYSKSPPVPPNSPLNSNNSSTDSAWRRIYYIDNVIYGDGTTLHFNYYNQNPRRDGENIRTLKSIGIVNVYNAGYNINFEHAHINRGHGLSGGITPLNDPNIAVGRNSLILTGFYKSSNSVNLLGYRFKYNTTTPLPLKFDDGVDLWGYANGKPSQYGRIAEYRDQNGILLHPGSDRTPNISYAKAASLSEIWNPNNGRIQIEYELHATNTTIPAPLSSYQYVPNVDFVGGLRVKKIISVDHAIESQSHVITNLHEYTKEYKYVELDGQTSSGVLYNYPISNFVYNDDYMVRTNRQLSYPLLTRGHSVGYRRVVEYRGTSTSFKEKRVYEFSALGDHYTLPLSLLNPHFPFPYIPNIDFVWGLTKSISLFNGNDQILSKKTFYWNISVNNYNNSDYLAVKAGIRKSPLPNGHNFTIGDYFGWSVFYPLSGKVSLAKTEERSYFGVDGQGQPLYQSKIIEKNYNNAYNVPTDIITKNYKSNIDLNIKLFYPFDFNANVNPSIAQLNNVGLKYSPLRVEKWLNYPNGTKQLLDVVVKDIQLQNGIVYNNLISKFAPSSPITHTQWGSFNQNSLFQNSQYFINQGSFERFDQFGNVNQVNINGIRISTFWGYNKRLPVAVIKNALLDDVAYTSFENGEVHGWVKTGTTQIVNGITGKSAGNLKQSIYAKEGLNSSKKYIITMYGKGSPPLATGVNTVTNATASVSLHPVEVHQGWTLYKGEVTNINKVMVFGIGVISGSGSTTIDELRLYPEGAQMETATYIPLYGRTSMCDMASKFESYEFDYFGRLIGIKDVDGNVKLAKEYNENYKPW